MTCEHKALGQRMAAEYAEHAQRRNVAAMLRDADDHTESMAALKRAMQRNAHEHETKCEGRA